MNGLDSYSYFQFPIPVSIPDPCGLFQVHQLQWVSPSPSCSTSFSTLRQNPSICVFCRFIFVFFLLSGPLEWHSYEYRYYIVFRQMCLSIHYKTLHSYNLIWAVCHLFPQQRWRTHTYSVSGNHWPGEPRDLRKTTSAHKFRPAFGATSKTRIFYKYVVFKHSSSFYTNSSQRIHALSSV